MPSSDMPNVCVLGAGVSGLTTALALEEAGFRVRIVAAATGASTTSAAAGAVWFPYRCDPPHLVNRWAKRTREWLIELSRRHPEAGVDVLQAYECAETAERPWWSDAAGGAQLVDDPLILRRFAATARYLWQFTAPRVEPLLFLDWAEKRLSLPIDRRRVKAFDDLDADLIVNCTGLQARGLTGDQELQAIYGQTVIVEPGNLDLRETIEDNRSIHGENQTFYTIPRRGEVVLGGVAIACSDDTPATPTAATREAILSRCAPYGLKPGRVVRDSAGLRPYRTTVRLERDPADPRIIHNYGHGGAGFTLSRGCAEDVVGLVRETK